MAGDFGIWQVDEATNASYRLEQAERAVAEAMLEDVFVRNPAMLMPGLELVGRQLPTANGYLVLCYSARRFNADRRANPLRSLDSGGSNFCADQQQPLRCVHEQANRTEQVGEGELARGEDRARRDAELVVTGGAFEAAPRRQVIDIKAAAYWADRRSIGFRPAQPAIRRIRQAARPIEPRPIAQPHRGRPRQGSQSGRTAVSPRAGPSTARGHRLHPRRPREAPRAAGPAQEARAQARQAPQEKPRVERLVVLSPIPSGV